MKRLAFLSLLLATPAQATEPKDMRAPDGAAIAAMCARIDAPGLGAGLVRSELDAAVLQALENDPGAPEPLGEARAVFTPWSDRLAAIEWTGEGFEGMEVIGWSEKLAETLDKYGWQPVEREASEATIFQTQIWSRALPGPDGPREMRLEVEEFGAFGLRCGPMALAELVWNEQLGDLAEGSPRPVRATDANSEARQILTILNCDDPALIAELSAIQQAVDVGSALEAIAGHLDVDNDLRFETRLRTWLEWRLLQSGKVQEEEIWTVREQALSEYDVDPLAGAENMMVSLQRIAEAVTRRDGLGICLASRDIVGNFVAGSPDELRSEAAVNAALEALARQHGVNID